MAVDLGEGGGFLVGIEAVGADRLTDDIAVFLFDETVVVFAVGSAAGKLDTVFPAPLPDLVVAPHPSPTGRRFPS